MVCRLLKKFSKVRSLWKLVGSEKLITFRSLSCDCNFGYRLHFSCKWIKRRYDGNKYDRYDGKLRHTGCLKNSSDVERTIGDPR